MKKSTIFMIEYTIQIKLFDLGGFTEKMNKETQMVAVEKVLEEMKKAEEFVMQWNSSWYEQLLDAYCLPFHHELGEGDVRDIERKYEPRYKLANAYYSGESIGVPLIRETLVGDNTLTGERNVNFECEFGRIDWYGMNSHKSSRHFSFNNNGDIKFSKDVKRKQTIQHPKQRSYETSYNVLSTDFTIKIKIDELTQDCRNKYKYDYLTLSLEGNILTEKFNDIEIIQDLNTGVKIVRIAKKYDKRNKDNNASVVFEAVLNADDSLEMGAVAINTHKGNGKVNGTYRFDVSRKKGIRANFYSRKGVKVDLTTNPMLLGTANTLLLPSSSSHNSSDLIVSDFATSTQNAIAKGLSEKVISFDNSDFNMESVKQAESRILEMVKCIKGELPLSGLVERIDNCISLLEAQKQEKLEGKAKTLRLN